MSNKRYYKWLDPSPERNGSGEVPRTTEWRLANRQQDIVHDFPEVNPEGEDRREAAHLQEPLHIQEVELSRSTVSLQSSDQEDEISNCGDLVSGMDGIGPANTSSHSDQSLEIQQSMEYEVSDSGDSLSVMDDTGSANISTSSNQCDEHTEEEEDSDGDDFLSALDAIGTANTSTHSNWSYEVQQSMEEEFSDSDNSLSALDTIETADTSTHSHPLHEDRQSVVENDLHHANNDALDFGENIQYNSGNDFQHSLSESQPSSSTETASGNEDEASNQVDFFPYPPPLHAEDDVPIPHLQQENQQELDGNMNIDDNDPYFSVVFQTLKQNLQGPFKTIIREQPQLSRGELLLNTLFLVNHFRFNFAQFEGIMKLINSIFKKDILPDTRYKLDVLLKSFSGMHYHFVCSTCFHYFRELDHSILKEVSCEVCSTVNHVANLNNSHFFVMFDLPPQIEVLLCNDKILQNLKNPFHLVNNEEPRVMKDVYDGHMYQQFIASLSKDPADVRHLSFCFSVDGASLYRSSNCEIWPLLCCLLELPPDIRSHNLLLGGLWFGKKKPKQDVFLKPFIEHCRVLSSEGFKIKIKNEVVNMKGHLLCCCADAPARAAVQCVHQHNGSYGCNWCLHPGEHRKYITLDYVPPARTVAELIADGTAALNIGLENASVNGVTGITPCLSLPTLDIVDGMILEYFHATTHGIARQLTGAWLGDDGADEKIIPYYIGRPAKLKTMDNYLTAIRAPVEARRPPRKITEKEHWKGREYENFILYYSVPVLLQILPTKYLKHWCLFVQAMHFLLQEEVSENNVNKAHKLLAEFVVLTEDVYGPDNGEAHMTYNMHICLHLAENVKRWGPLWCLNGYCFEDGNRILKNTINANLGVASQVCRSLSHVKAMEILDAYTGTPSSAKFKNDIEKKLAIKCILVENDKYIGTHRSFNPTAEVTFLCNQKGIVDIESFVEVEKLIHCICVYTTCKNRSSKTDNSVALLNNNDIVLIEKIIVCEPRLQGFLIVRQIRTAPHLVIPGVQPNEVFLKSVVLTDQEHKIILPSELQIVCARMTLPHGDFIVKVPNRYNTS